jgi:hypothetical protein
MTDSDVLQQTLADSVTWNRARLKVLTRLILDLLQVRSVNLARLAAAVVGKAGFDSRYKQLQRFLRYFELPFDELTRLPVKMIDAKPPFILVLDRTEWKVRGQAINVLVLCLWLDGVCRPILWHVLAKAGSTSHLERVALLDEFNRLIGFRSVKYLIGDREFHGKQFYQYLREQHLNFRLRVRHDTAFTGGDGRVVRGRELVRGLAIGVTVRFRRRQLLWGNQVWVWAKRLSETETLLVVAPATHKKSHLFVEYGERWRIEEMFESIKTRGFGLESTRICQPARLRRLMAIVAIAFIWAVRVGEVHLQKHPVKRNRKGRRIRSVFRVGLDHLTQIISHPTESWALSKFIEAVQLLCRNIHKTMRL